ncbi:nadh-cytochrome b5 [Drechmeria coniospora]|uniref:NADH-cytochrome b5 reductase n=1 Tax=Drechmeria coniospora TaxID=98403 RepID=A0A151GMZ4_DRECN|nr:nadh-cytochrome b5 [Drechmeria coniospora]KYK58485.1 nadh-cytochrome b5 [Drechmeria coniospora]
MASSIAYRPRLVTAVGTLAAAGLAVGIASKLLVKEAHADSPTTRLKVFGAGPAFFSLPLESGEMVNHNTRRLRFRFADKDAVSGLPLTSSVLTFSWPKGRSLPVVRPYTPVTSSDEPGYLEFLVKRYPDGKSSTHLHSLEPGESLFFLASLKGFQWTANAFRHVTLVAGGAGITPIFQLAQGILRNPADKTAITLVMGVNSDQDILLKKEFEDLERRFPGRFHAVYTVSHPVPGSPYKKGYVTKELLQEVAVPRTAQGEATKVFVCGPPAMEKSLVGDRATKGVLQELGYRKDQIYKF